MLTPFIESFLFGISIIASIGAENSFLLREAIRGNHLVKLWVSASILDILAIYICASSMGVLLMNNEYMFVGVTTIGIFFMLYLGVSSLKNSIKPKPLIADSAHTMTSFKKVFLSLVGVVLFNGQMWIEGVFVVGSAINAHVGEERVAYYLGFYAASIVWFGLIMFFGKKLAPYFKKLILWRILDLLSGLIIIFIAYVVMKEVDLVGHITKVIELYNSEVTSGIK